jgi:hypothetical protein
VVDEDETREQLEEDANDDLELEDGDAETVAGGWDPLKIRPGTATDALQQ